jgi:hypothetical protein
MIGDITNTLYQTFYTYKFDAIIFMASKFNTEIFQFINEFDNIKVFIYHDILNPALFDLSLNIVHLLDNYKNKNQDNIRNIPLLINKQLYDSISNISMKYDVMVCFLDGLPNIPEQLSKFLYPNTKLPIKLFNNENIYHSQNLGMLNEVEKAHILKQAKYYITINNLYVAEAMASGCIVLAPEEIDDMVPKKYKNKKDYNSYSNFIENLMT